LRPSTLKIEADSGDHIEVDDLGKGEPRRASGSAAWDSRCTRPPNSSKIVDRCAALGFLPAFGCEIHSIVNAETAAS
jgi:hypothetical protein